MPSDYSESMKAKSQQCQHAQKNWGLGHNEMNTDEEEADDERIMKEADAQDDRRRIKRKKALMKVTPQDDGSREEMNHQVRCRLVKGKRPAPRPSARSLHCHCFSERTPSGFRRTEGMQNRYFFALQPPAIFRCLSRHFWLDLSVQRTFPSDDQWTLSKPAATIHEMTGKHQRKSNGHPTSGKSLLP
jgi:hypothetical protein